MSEKERQWDRAIFEAILAQNFPKTDKSHQNTYFKTSGINIKQMTF